MNQLIFLSGIAVALFLPGDTHAQKKPTTPSLAGSGAKIIGGKNATPDEYPWMVVLRRKDDSNDFIGHFCGGSLIHPYWVLTAAHCVEDATADEMQVVIGAYDLLNPKGTQTIDVVDIIIHPDFINVALGSDVALLLLASPPNPLPQTIDLPTDSITHPPGTDAVAIGWGLTIPDDNDSAPTILQSVTLPVVSLSEANKPESYDGDLIFSMLPAGLPIGGIDTCKGDSGGPLVIRDGTTGRYSQIGVTSVGDGCGQPGKYGIYTRVTSFLPWINSFITPNIARWENQNATVLAGNESDDIDNDGQSALLEFAGDTIPQSPSSRALLTPTMVAIGNETSPAITFSRYLEPSEIIYKVQWTSSLSPATTWTDVDTSNASVLPPVIDPTNPFREIITLRVSARETTGYFRLQAIRQRLYIPATESLTFPTFRSRNLTPLDLAEPQPANGLQKRFLLAPTIEPTKINITARSTAFTPTLRVLEAATNTMLATTSTSGEKITLTTVPEVSYLVEMASPSSTDTGPFTIALFGDLGLETLPTVTTGHNASNTLSAADPFDPIFLPQQYYKHDYLLSAPPGVFLELKMISSSIDSYLVIINAETGRPISDSDDGLIANQAHSYIPFVTSAVVPPLLIRVSTSVELETGVYTLSASPGPTHQLATTSSGNLSAADPINKDGSHHDTYLLTGQTPGTPITISLTSSAFDTYLQLFDGQNQLLDSNDDANDAAETDSSLTFTPKIGIHYLIQATSFDAGEVGPYALTTSE